MATSLALLLVQQVNVYDAAFLYHSDWYFIAMIVVLLVKDWIGVVLYRSLQHLGRYSGYSIQLVQNNGFLSSVIVNAVFYGICILHAHWLHRSSTFWVLFFTNINLLELLKLLGIKMKRSGKVNRSDNNPAVSIVGLYAVNIPSNEFIRTDKLASFALIDNITVVHQYFHDFRLFSLSIVVSLVQGIYIAILISVLPLLYIRPDVLYSKSSCYALVVFNVIFLTVLYLFLQVWSNRGLLLLDSKTQASSSYVNQLIKTIWSYEQTPINKSSILHYLLLIMMMILVIEVLILLAFGLRRKSFLSLCFVKLGTISFIRLTLDRCE